jgi:hypothetical protein
MNRLDLWSHLGNELDSISGTSDDFLMEIDNQSWHSFSSNASTVVPYSTSPSSFNSCNSSRRPQVVKAHKFPAAKATFNNHNNPSKVVNQLQVISASDIRRSFAILFTEAVNLGDDEEIARLFRTHCTNDMKFRIEFTAFGDVKNSLEVRGLDAVVPYVLAMQEAIPDCLVELKTTNLKALSTGLSTIICTLSFSGIKVIDMIGDRGKVLVVSSLSDNPKYGLEGMGLVHEIRPSPTHASCSESLLTNMRSPPVAFSGSGRLTFQVDCNKLIYDMHLLYTGFASNRCDTSF